MLGELKALYDSNRAIFDRLADDDAERSAARFRRLAEAVPSTPAAVYGLVVLTLAVSVAGFAFSLPRRRNRAHLVTLCVLAALLAATVLLIRDLDLAFAGVAKIGPTAMADARDEITANFQASYAGDRLPCDETGAAS